jgi:hypothetical protein
MLSAQQRQQQVRAAWAKLPPDLKARLEPQILAAHENMLHVRNNATSQSTDASMLRAGDRAVSQPGPPARPELLMLYSVLHDDPDGLLNSAANPAAEGILSPSIDPYGQISYSNTQYDNTDTGWSYIVVALAETNGHLAPFNSDAQVMEIPDDATLAILGDWGGGNPSARSVAAAAKGSKANYFVHLGDVYYAGTNEGVLLKPYESTLFLDVWPGPDGGSFALNSNHDMYAQGTGYFRTTLAPVTAFKAQKGASFFALYNKSFRIVGLDSAYFSSASKFYDDGTLGTVSGNRQQANFLREQAKLAAGANQNLILMTHHNGLSVDGSAEESLWWEVANELDDLSGKSVCWYWGHWHVGAVYKPREVNGVTIHSRCCGHGCIPWGVATALRTSGVVWFEQKVLGPQKDHFVTNGYATLGLSGASMTETFHDQSGNPSWSDRWPPAVPVA